MNVIDRNLRRPDKSSAEITISRVDGSILTVRLRLLGYDGCEFESSHSFAPAEQISIRIYRMGSIRARIVSQQSGVVEAEFVKESPV